MAKVILIDKGTFQEIQIGQELTIGRAYSNLLRLEGEEISRVHGILYRRGSDYILRDLDSKNGVFVNGQKLVNTVVGPGDEIQIGKYVLLFDPDADYDISAFLRKHHVDPPGEITADPEEMETGCVVKEIKRKASSAAASPQDTLGADETLFLSVEEIEELAGSHGQDYSSELLSELLRMHRELGKPLPEDSDEYEVMCQHYLEAALQALGAGRGVIVLRDGASDVLRLGAIVPRDKDVAVNRVVLRSALREKRAVLCNDVMHDERFLKTETVTKEKIGSLIAYPLLRDETPFGLVYADVQERPNAFRREQLIILHFMARLLLFSLDRAPNGK